MKRTTWTDEAIRALGARTDVATAGSIFTLSRTQSYEAIAAGRFPVPVIRVGRRMVVPTAPIRRLLEIDDLGHGEPGRSPMRPDPSVAARLSRSTREDRTALSAQSPSDAAGS